MRVIINRIEKDTAVLELENGKTANAPVCLFENAAEGGVYHITADPSQAQALKAQNEEKLKRLFGRSK